MTDLHDREVETWYRGGARAEPPLALDAAILAAAHRAVGAGPTLLARRPRPVWMLPLAAAAVLVVSVTVLRLAPQEEILPSMSAPRDAPAQESAAAPDSKPVVLPEKTAQNAASAAGALIAQDAASVPSAARPAPAAPPPALAKSAVSTAAASKETESAKEQRETQRERVAPEPVPALPRAAAAPQPLSEQALAVVESRAIAPAPAALPPVGPVAPATHADQALGEALQWASRKEKSAPAEAKSAARPSTEPTPAAAAALRASVAPGGRAAEAALLAPEAWISKLLSLQAAGPESEFLKELAAFRAAFPDHPLPPSLQAALSRLGSGEARPFPSRH